MPMRGAAVNLTREPSLSSHRQSEATRSSRLSERSILRSLVNRPGPSAPSTPRFVHPVAEVDVGAAARRVHHVRPRRAPLVRVAGGVLLAAVGLCLGNAPPHDSSVLQSAAEPRADERLRRRHRVNRIIVCRQSAHFLFGSTFTLVTFPNNSCKGFHGLRNTPSSRTRPVPRTSS